MRRRPLATLLVGAVLVAACGSTVPTASRSATGTTASGSGLDAAAPDGLQADDLTVDAATGTGGGGPGSAAPHPGAPAAAGPAGQSATAPPGSGTRAAGASARGPASSDSATTGPLQIGVAYLDNSSTESSLGVSTDSSANGRTVSRALVRGYNERGGMHGRLLEDTVEYGWDTSSNNYAADASAACARFTQDHRVDVVLDSAFGTIGGFSECLARAGVLHITGGAEGDRQSSLQRPLHANVDTMVTDRSYAAVLSNLAATGYLSGRNQLGIMIEQCPAIERAYASTILPLSRKLGLKTPLVRSLECTTGFSAAGPAQASVSSAILAFRQAEVDRVMFMSDYESVVLLLFGNTASSQRFFPGYALTSNAQPELLRSSIPEDQWPQLHGVGTSPGGDVAPARTPPSRTEARCLDLVKAGGLAPSGHLDRVLVYASCGEFVLLEAALGATGGASDPAALMSAINGLGTSFAAPGLVANATRFSGDRHDGPDAVQVFGFVERCSCLRYRGQPLRAPR